MKKLLFILLASLATLSCAQLGEPVNYEDSQSAMSCAEPRVTASFQFHDQAKKFMQSFYKTRKESELFYAWYASEDSIYMAKTIKDCWDKKNKHYYAAQNVMAKNDSLRKLIIQNMRLDQQRQLSELFLEEYREIFVRDIQ